jgi:hypothetical protein
MQECIAGAPGNTYIGRRMPSFLFNYFAAASME